MSSISLNAASNRATPNRWLTLTTVALAQLMVILDSTVVNIALPSAWADGSAIFTTVESRMTMSCASATVVRVSQRLGVARFDAALSEIEDMFATIYGTGEFRNPVVPEIAGLELSARRTCRLYNQLKARAKVLY